VNIAQDVSWTIETFYASDYCRIIIRESVCHRHKLPS